MSEKDLPPAVERMPDWRERNGFTQGQAFRAMHRQRFPVTLTTFQKGETEEPEPTQITALALSIFGKASPCNLRERTFERRRR